MYTKDMFEWDESKNQINKSKHGIDFREALDVFADPNMIFHLDKREDYGETRYNAYGYSKDRRLRVCFTERNEKIRIISVFKVHKKEWESNYGKDS